MARTSWCRQEAMAGLQGTFSPQLLQVLMNLVQNAYDAASQRPGALPALWIACEAADGWVRVSLRDSGPGIAEAAVIGIAHPKWDERPLLILVKKEGAEVTAKDVLAYLDGRIAKWWMPDAIEFVDEIPHTATGKIQKTTLRERFASYKLALA